MPDFPSPSLAAGGEPVGYGPRRGIHDPFRLPADNPRNNPCNGSAEILSPVRDGFSLIWCVVKHATCARPLSFSPPLSLSLSLGPPPPRNKPSSGERICFIAACKTRTPRITLCINGAAGTRKVYGREFFRLARKHAYAREPDCRRCIHLGVLPGRLEYLVP